MKHYKSVTCFAALLTGLALVPASGYLTSEVSVVKAADQQEIGTTNDGYDYELWNQNGTGSAKMTVGSNGSFTCSWQNIENCLFRTGKKLGSTKTYKDYGTISITYDVDYTPNGNSYMCVYGWTEEPTVEYYIVEAWGDWRPPGMNNGKGTITSDGKTYDIYTSIRDMQPSIHGTETFEQYWSVNKTNPAKVYSMTNLKGTITVSDHFAAWERTGMKMGLMYEVALNVEGYRSNGSAEVKKNLLTIGGDPQITTAPPSTTTPPATTEPPQSSSKIIFGDLDGSKDVDLSDLTALSQYLLSDVKFNAEQLAAADVTGDGSVDVSDLALLKQYVMNDDVTLGGKGSSTDTGSNDKTPTGSGSGVTDGFEKSGTDWSGRGDVTIKLTDSFKHGGSQALAVSGRTDSWQGFQCASSELKAGGSYSLDVYVGYNNSTYSSKGFEFGVQYDDSTGTQYVNVAKETVSSGKWGLLSGSFDIPSGASNISVYVQTEYTETPGASDLIDFYIDDAKLTVLESSTPDTGNDSNGGSTPTGVGSKGKVVNGKWTSNADTSWIDPNKPMVAISFDDGPIAGSQNPGRIQNALTKNGFHATFFYWGERIRGNEQEIKNAYNAGFEVANHTWSHPQLTQQGDKGKNEVYKCKQALDAIIGGDNDYLLRPPYLATDSGVCAAVGVPMPNCGLDTKDWDGASKDQILNTLKSALANGSLRNKVVLCHENYDSTAGAMEEFLPYLKSQGWQCVTVSEMFAAQGKTMQAGVVYDYVK